MNYNSGFKTNNARKGCAKRYREKHPFQKHKITPLPEKERMKFRQLLKKRHGV